MNGCGEGCKMKNQLLRNRTTSGLSLVELLIGLTLSSIVLYSGYEIFKGTTKSSLENVQSGKSELDIKRFVSLVSSDIERAGSDSHGNALYALLFTDCSDLTGSEDEDFSFADLNFLYGINPQPTDAGCTQQIGEIGFLSYQAFDADGDGTIDIEEGLDMGATKPDLRFDPEDYIVYDLYDSDGDNRDDTIRRINVGDQYDDSDDQAVDVLRNVAEFQLQYFGIKADEEGGYGEITDPEYFNDMREVQVTVFTFYGDYDPNYENENFSDDHPYYHFKTNRHIFRVGVNVIKPEI